MSRTTEMVVYNDQYERGQNIKDLDKVLDILDSRTKDTFILQGISGLDVIKNGVKVAFRVGEVDENLISLNNSLTDEEFFISKYVWNHLCGYLGIPSDVWNYLQRGKGLEEADYEIFRANEAENMALLFNSRLDKVAASKRTKDIFITVFDDVFGRFPRVIHSELYFPYEDYKAVQTTHNGLMAANKAHNDRNYEFESAFITPYQTSSNWNNTLTKQLVKVGDEIESGISNINSECKLRSLTYKGRVVRLACLNGVVSRVPSASLRIRHYENGFEQKMKHGFIEVLKVENAFAKQYLDAGRFDQTFDAIEDWSDLMNKIPSSYLAMKAPEKAKLAEIGTDEGYEKSPYGVLQALTYQSSHKIHDDAGKDRVNDKALHWLDNIEIIASWTPPPITA